MPGGYDYGLPPDEEPRPIEYPEEWDDLDEDDYEDSWIDDEDDYEDSWIDDGDDEEFDPDWG